MSIRDFEERKLRQQLVAKTVEEAAVLFKRLLVFSRHNNSCCCLEPYEDSCTCGYTKLIRDIAKFTETA